MKQAMLGWMLMTGVVLGCSSQDPRVVTAQARSPETVAQAQSASTAQALSAAGQCPAPDPAITPIITWTKNREMVWFGQVVDLKSNSNGQPLGVVSPSSTGPMRGEAIPGCAGTALHFLSTVTARGEGYGFGNPPGAKLSEFTGIALWVRGSSRRGIQINIGTTDTMGTEGLGHCVPADGKRCYGAHAANVPLSDHWQQVRIPFTAFEQPPWAVPAPLDASHTIGVGFRTLPNEQDVWIASMGLYHSSQDPKAVAARAQSLDAIAQAQLESTARALAASGHCPALDPKLTHMIAWAKDGEMAWFGHVGAQTNKQQPLGVVSPSWNGPMRGEAIPKCSGSALHFLSTATARGEGYGLGDLSQVTLSDFTGVVLWVRGSSRQGIAINIGTTDTIGKEGKGNCEPVNGKMCYGFHTAQIPVSDDWKQVRIPFSAFAQPPWAVPTPLDLSHATLFGVQTRPEEQDVWIASIDLYR